MNDYKKYLKPEVIAQIQNIEMKAKLVVEGFITGLHKSPYHGFSVEFAEHRQYRPGDEIKHIDWKVYGRSNKYYVKQYEEETNLRAVIAIDSSASMKYGSKGNISKYEYASYLAAALATLLIRQRDAVGLALYDNELKKFLPPNSKPSYIHPILKTIDDYVPSNETGTAKALDELAERIKRRGLVIIISDFFDDIKSVTDALKHFRHRNHDVLALQVLDPKEINFDFGEGANFIDLETGEEIVTQPYQIQKAYKGAVSEFINQVKRECQLHKIDYHLISTADTFDKALREYLTKRSKM